MSNTTLAAIEHLLNVSVTLLQQAQDQQGDNASPVHKYPDGPSELQARNCRQAETIKTMAESYQELFDKHSTVLDRLEQAEAALKARDNKLRALGEFLDRVYQFQVTGPANCDPQEPHMRGLWSNDPWHTDSLFGKKCREYIEFCKNPGDDF